MTVVAMHQPNLLPGLSVIGKIAAADLVIWCDEMQFTRYGWVNRNRLEDGTPLTVPVDHRDLAGPINRVRIAERPRWRDKLARTLTQHLGADAAAPFTDEIRRPYRLLVGLNVGLLRCLLDTLNVRAAWCFQSHLGAGRDARNVSELLAGMAAEVGATEYLSGPTGRAYLDETPFLELGIPVRYWEHDGPNHSAVSLVNDRRSVAA